MAAVITGQIGLSLRLHERRSFWTRDDIDWLVEERSLAIDTPSGRAWIALAICDLKAARVAIDEYRVVMTN